MDNPPNRSISERFFDRLLTKNDPQAVETSLPEPSPEIQSLASRITEIISLGSDPQALTPEQRAQWERIKVPFSLTIDRYDILKVYRSWRRDPEDPAARKDFQSNLLGVLIMDQELLEKFKAALPLPVPEWLASDAVDAAAGVEIVERIMLDEPVSPLIPEPVAQEGLSVEPLALSEEGKLPGIEDLIDELLTGGELYHIVYAMRYSNPALFNLAVKLTDEQKLCIELDEVFSKSKLGTQLLKK